MTLQRQKWILVVYLAVGAFAPELAAQSNPLNQAQSVSSQQRAVSTVVPKRHGPLELRSAGRMFRDNAIGRMMLGSGGALTAFPRQNPGQTLLRGPNVQVNDPALEHIQFITGFPPLVRYTESETTVAARGQNIVVSYNTTTGVTVDQNGNYTSILIDGYSFSGDGGRTWTSGYVPAAPGVGPFTFGDGVLAVDRRGTFYYASLGMTADGHGAVVLNISSDGGRTFAPGVIVAVDDGSDKNWIGVGPDPSQPGRDNIYIAWTSYYSGGSAVAFAVSKDGGQSFQSRIIYAPGSDPDPTHPQNQIQFPSPVVDRSNGRLYIPFAHFSNSDTDFLQMLVSNDAGQSFHFADFNIPGALDPTLIPLVQPGTFEDCGDGGLRLSIIQGTDVGGGQFGLPRFVQSSRLTIQPALAVENGIVFLSYNASDSPVFGDPNSGSNILLLRSTDGGQTWIGPNQVNPTRSNDHRHIYPATALQSAGQKINFTYYTQHLDRTVDLDFVSADRSNNFMLGNATRVTSQAFNLTPSNIPVPTMENPYHTVNFDLGIAPCYDLGEYVGLFNNNGSIYASWGDNRNQVTEPIDPLDPISGQTHAQPDTFFQRLAP
jgi:hypothetical protein